MADQERDFLDDMTSAAPAADTPAPEVDPELQPEPQRVETVEKQPEAPAPEAPTAPEVKEDKTVPLPALLAEREKRQALERQLAEMKQQAQLQQPVPEFFEAPEHHLQVVEQRATQRLHAALEEQAKAVYPDFDDVVGVVIEAAQGNPAIQQQVFSAANPALAAYQLGKKLQEQAHMADPVAYRAKIEAEVRAQVEAEQAAKAASKAAAAAAIPPDLSQARNAAGQFAAAAPSPVDELFPR